MRIMIDNLIKLCADSFQPLTIPFGDVMYKCGRNGLGVQEKYKISNYL